MKPNCEYITMDEFHEYARANHIHGPYIVCIWYRQSELYPVEILNEFVWIEHDFFEWDMDWDEGGEAYVIGYECVYNLDIKGKGDLFNGKA